MWHPVTSIDKIPTGRDLRLAVIDAQGNVHALVFPCRRIEYRLVDARTERTVDVQPTHWQAWVE